MNYVEGKKGITFQLNTAVSTNDPRWLCGVGHSTTSPHSNRMAVFLPDVYEKKAGLSCRPRVSVKNIHEPASALMSTRKNVHIYEENMGSLEWKAKKKEKKKGDNSRAALCGGFDGNKLPSGTTFCCNCNDWRNQAGICGGWRLCLIFWL